MSLSKGKILCLLSVVTFTSCISPEMREQFTLLDFDSLLTAQSKYLALHHTTLTKKASIDGQKESIEAVPDSIGWNTELSIFREINSINNPRSLGIYEVSGELTDPKSNLKIYEYRAKTKSSLPYLRIYYQNEIKNIKKIEARYNEENALYVSTRFMTLQFTDIDKQQVLTSYSITGSQKMILSDSVKYYVTATIIHPE